MKGGKSNKMEEDKTNEPQEGLWDKLPTEERELMPKVLFDINIPKTLIFITEPREMKGDSGVYYQFDVIDPLDNTNKIIQTSAWTLLRGLKLCSPLENTRVTIVKRINAGKQSFEVTKLPKVQDVEVK